MDEMSSRRDEPDWLRSARSKAFGVYAEIPIETSELYSHYTDAKRMDPAQVVLNGEASANVPSMIRARIGELSSSDAVYAVQVGSRIAEVHVPDRLADSGLGISSLHDALSSHPDLVRAAIESADVHEDRFTALSTAAFDSGIFVYVPARLELDARIHIVTCLPDGGTSTISRNVVHVDKSSSASIVQELYAPDVRSTQSYIELLTSTVDEGARLDVTTLQMMGAHAVNFSTRRAQISRDAESNWYLGMFGASLARYRIDYDLVGPGAIVNDSEVAFGSASQCFDLSTCTNHLASSTIGRVTEKSILRDSSKSLFKGMIRIHKNATKSHSYLSGRSILLDPGAKSDAIPGLEIETNDVKATHSASVAQIDDEQLFYLQARCMSKPEAERIIVLGTTLKKDVI